MTIASIALLLQCVRLGDKISAWSVHIACWPKILCFTYPAADRRSRVTEGAFVQKFVQLWRPSQWWLRSLVLITVAMAGALVASGSASAQMEGDDASPTRDVSTPYAGVVVQPGSTIQLNLQVTSPELEPVGLAIEAPAGWQTTLRGGGFVVTEVTASPDTAGTVQLEIAVPVDAAIGDHKVKVTAQFPEQTAQLTISLEVQEEINSGVLLSVDFPSLEGGPADTFTYTLTVVNNTPEAQTFTFAPTGPSGWELSASPVAQQQANTVNIEAGASADVSVSARPAAGTPAGEYVIDVGVVGASGAGGSGILTAVVTGTPQLFISTSDGQLNADGQAGDATIETILITNEGSAPLDGVQFASTPPSQWEVTFEPSSIEAIAPGETTQVQATIRPGSDAITGDYAITIRASSGTNSDQLDLRYSVRTSSWVGLIAAIIIVSALGGLATVYRRFGRR